MPLGYAAWLVQELVALRGYAPMQLVAPRAVTIAVAILAIIWMMNFSVSFLLIAYLLPLVHV
jgi:hypothetical protein